MGRPPKPTSQKRLEGTYRPDRSAPNEPAPEPGRPACPPHLEGPGRAIWEHFAGELLALKVLTVRDGAALELLCDAYQEWHACREMVEREGRICIRTTETGGEILSAHPAVRMKNDACRLMHRMLLEFGLTPAARTRVSATAPKPPAERPKASPDWIRGRLRVG